ncbi:nicotinamidase-like amidase [Caulobacter sp. AP07]|uniref:cysteine hydrolase n=1 Tax=Caulobacter sp. AP07 TaxID=1144304 RepID=UPI0002720778|nr:cysteine hydrolase [Caulobacter sp. AP07]EJL22124.1 nicotinamidase-like amidase [Caulobacter sp. AP07]
MKRFNSLDIPTDLADLCDPSRTAVLVYDMQAGICGQIASGAAVTARCAEVLAVARRAGYRVAYTRHLSLSKPWMGVTQLRMAMAWQRKSEPAEVSPWFLRDSPPWEIVPDLAPHADDAVFDKLAMSAFEGTPLATALRDSGVQAVVLMGIALEIGIEPTARHAADLGFIPIIVADACGAGHEDAAQRSLESLRFAGDAIITDVAALTALMAR